MESMSEYHANPAYGASSLKRLIFESPMHMRLGENKQTKAKDFGTTVHTALLEPQDFLNRKVVEPTWDRRTKEYKNWKAREVQPDSILISEKELAGIQAIKKNLENKGLLEFLEGQKEVSLYSQLDDANLKCRPDVLNIEKKRIVDLKTTKSIITFPKDARYYHYEFSAVHYKNIVKILYDIEIDYLFFAVENVPPYDVQLFDLSSQILDEASKAWDASIDLLKRCIEKDMWPGAYHGTKCYTIEANRNFYE